VSLQVLGFNGPYMAEIAQSIERLGLAYSVLSTNEHFGASSFSWPTPVSLDRPIMIAPSYPQERLALASLLAEYRGVELFSVVDPSAVVATNSIVGHGSHINSLVSIGANSALGCSVFINRASTVGHDSRIGNFVSTGPGAVISGQVAIGGGSFIGAGAVIKDGISIGNHAYIGAGSVVVDDVPDYALVFGNPAKHKRENKVDMQNTLCPWCGS